MAYRYLQRQSKENEDVKTYLDEGMIFEAFITLIREAPTTDDIDEIEYQAEKEFEVKSRQLLTEEELESIQVEATDYRKKLMMEE